MIQVWHHDVKQGRNYELPLFHISIALIWLGQVQALQLEAAAEVSPSV